MAKDEMVSPCSRLRHEIPSCDSEPPHFGVEGGSFETQLGRSPLWSTNEAFSLSQGTDNVFAFRVFEGRDLRRATLRNVFQLRQRGLQCRSTRQNYRPIKEVLQFADVPRPLPFHEVLHDARGNR